MLDGFTKCEILKEAAGVDFSAHVQLLI